MTVNVAMGSGGECVSVSIHSAGSGVSGYEEDKDELRRRSTLTVPGKEDEEVLCGNI